MAPTASASQSKTRSMALIALFAVLIAICSWISIPTLIPFTLQTFAVCLAVSMALGLMACYAFGTVWYVIVYARTAETIGFVAALGVCVFPYVIPDLVKLALALLLSRRLRTILKLA